MSDFKPLFGHGGKPTPPEAEGFEPIVKPKPPSENSGFVPLNELLASPNALPDLQSLQEELAAAREEGIAQGRADATADLEKQQAQTDQLGAAMRTAMQQLTEARVEALRQAGDQVGTIIVEVCQRVLGDSLALNPTALPKLVQDTLAQLPEQDEVHIRVHPDQLDAIRDALGPSFRDQVEGDAAVDAGCIIEAKHATIDATVEAALEGVRGAIQQWVGEL